MAALFEYLFGSTLRAKLIAQLFQTPDTAYYIRELERILEEDSTNISRELRRMEQFNLVTVRTQGRKKYYQSSKRHPLFPELFGMVMKEERITEILAEVFEDLHGLDLLVLYELKNLEQSAHELLMILVGDIQYEDMNRRIFTAEDRLDRSLSVQNFRRQEFREKINLHSLFLTDVFSGPHIIVLGNIENWSIEKLLDV